MRSLPYDRDLTPVFNVAEVAHILVVPASLPVKTLADLIAYAKANPGKVNYGSAGFGSPPHLSVELSSASRHQADPLPYKGLGPAMPDMLSGRLQLLSIARLRRHNLKTGASARLPPAPTSGLPDCPTCRPRPRPACPAGK